MLLVSRLRLPDQDDADTLRRDPLLKLLCGRLPETDTDLASQPTFSRLENAMDRHACYRLAFALVEVYLCQRERDGAPTLVVFDRPTGQLVTAILRPGTAYDSRGVLALLERLLPRLQARWPGWGSSCAPIAASPLKLYVYCEAERVDYIIGSATNVCLKDLAAPQLAEAQCQHAIREEAEKEEGDGAKERLVGEGATGPTAGSAAWCSKRRPCPKGRRCASSSRAAPMRRWRSTTGTSTSASRRAGLKT